MKTKISLISTFIFILIMLFSCKSEQEKLFNYVQNNDYEKLVSLIENQDSIDLNQLNEEGKSPIFIAVENDNLQITKLLIKNNINIHYIYDDTISILGLSILKGNKEIIKLILNSDSLIDNICYKNQTPLIYAVNQSDSNLTKFFINLKANINLKDSLGNTAIFYASDLKTFQLLAKEGAKFTNKNNENKSVKENAETNNYTEIIDYLNYQTKIVLNDVNIAKKIIPEVDYKKAFINITKRHRMPLGAYSEGFGSFEYASLHNYKILTYSEEYKIIKSEFHPFVAALEYAHYEHRPLVITPDMVWLLICQGLSVHIQKNPEKFRDLLVDFEGKEQITVYRSSEFDSNSKTEWENVVPEFSNHIKERVGDSLHNIMVTNFTTTTLKEQIAFEITYLDVMKNYFNYSFITCGIPYIILEGTPEDWKKIYTNIDYFRKFELNWWLDKLKPILLQFYNASIGDIDYDFWKKIFTINLENRCEQGQPFTGWHTYFFPYIYKTDFFGEEYEPKIIVKKNPNLLYNKNIKLDYKDFLSGMALVPFIWNDGENDYNMEFSAGFVGIKQKHETKALRPEIGWGVIKK